MCGTEIDFERSRFEILRGRVSYFFGPGGVFEKEKDYKFVIHRSVAWCSDEYIMKERGLFYLFYFFGRH